LPINRSTSHKFLVTPTSERLHNIRYVHRRRGGGVTVPEIAYWAYAGILAIGITGFPLVRAVVLFLAQESSLRILMGASMRDIVTDVAAASALSFALLGAVRGPALMSPFFVYAISGSDMPRSRSLLRPFVVSSAIVVVAAIALAGLVAGVLVVATDASSAKWATFVVGVMFLSILTCVGWLLGQAAGSRRWIFPITIFAVIILSHFFSPMAVISPWHWLASTWPDAQGSGRWLAPLAAVCVLSTLLIPRLLNSMDNAQLLRQSGQWQSATTSAAVGDAATALGIFRAQPRVGRRWTAVNPATVVLRFLQRDIVGAFRTPLRMVLCFLALVAAYSLVGVAPAVAGVEPWICGLAAGVLGFLALGICSDGFRHAAEAAGAAPLYRYSPIQLYLLHGALPLATSTIAAVASTVLLAAFTGSIPASLIITTLLLSLLLVVVRAYDSVKGPLPPALLTPIPTPFGDVSALVVLGWQSDALIVSAAIGVGVVTLSRTAGGTSLTLILTVAALVALLQLFRRRLQFMR
jgi:hypothetical protein